MNTQEKLTPHQIVVRAFNGTRSAARALDLDVGAVSRWGKTGLVPSRYQRRVLETAWRLGIDLTAHDIVFGRFE